MSKRDPATASVVSSFAPGDRVAVLLPLPLENAYTYRVVDGFPVVAGTFTEVPLGRRRAIGVVWGPGCDAIDTVRIRDISAVLPLPPLPETTRRFVDWVARYTVNPPGAVLKMAMSVPSAFREGRSEHVYGLAAPIPDGPLTATQARVVAVAADGQLRSAAELAVAAGVGRDVIARLIAKSVLFRQHTADATSPSPDWQRPGVGLSTAQAMAADRLKAAVNSGFTSLLLDGPPGSGKTEVYFEAVAAALAAGRQVLVLLPEIALSAQWLERFIGRFGVAPVSWHSDMAMSERRRAWRAVLHGQARVVVGARSALFLPFSGLGLIIVDEEHDTSFKQEDGVAYHARDMAVVRARLAGIPIILASATPSLETWVNVESGRYTGIAIPARPTCAPPPPIRLVDLRDDRPATGSFIAPSVRLALAETIRRGEQALLFLNRRGYAPLTLCRACGHRLACPACTAWLVEHRTPRRLLCHHCGHRRPVPGYCPACGEADALAACGPGVERLAEEIRALFPDLRLGVATSDSLPGPRAAAELVRQIETHAVDVIIGTQIVAKGYHFPLLTLVGIVDADIGLTGGDLRASERTFQLLTQVAGRAGRADRAGRVLVQTTMPSHPLMRALAARDRPGFLAAEAEARHAARLPPYGRLAALILSARESAVVDAAAAALAKQTPDLPGGRILGPAPAPLSLLRGRHRRRFLLLAPRSVHLSPVVRSWIEAVRLPAAVRLQVDIDPLSFL